MGMVTAAVLPVTAVIGILIAVTRPAGSNSVLLAAGALALAGIALLVAGFTNARSRRR